VTALSREAAQECSPRRKPWGQTAKPTSPRVTRILFCRNLAQFLPPDPVVFSSSAAVVEQQTPSLFIRRPIIRQAVSI
jgi:hypothetical protein